MTYFYQTVDCFRSKSYALGIFTLPTVPCRVVTNNYTDCSSSCGFYSLQSTFVLMISFALFTSPDMEGRRKGRGYSPHFMSEVFEAQSSYVICPANEAECQHLILELGCRSLTLNAVFLPLIFSFYFIWVELIFLELVDVIYIIVGIPAVFIGQGKCFRHGGYAGLLLLAHLL